MTDLPEAVGHEADDTRVSGRPAGGAPDVDDTLVTDSAPAGDADVTVVVAHAAPAGNALPDDATAVVPPAARPSAGVSPSRRSRRVPAGVLRPPDAAPRPRLSLPDGVAPSMTAVVGALAGDAAPYRPRPVPPPPDAAPDVAPGGRPTRADAPHMPSVRRASRRRSRVALACGALACAVSLTGLWFVALAVIGG